MSSPEAQPDKENADAKLAGEQRKKMHRQEMQRGYQHAYAERKKGGPLRPKAPNGYRELTVEQQMLHPSGFYWTELNKQQGVPPSPVMSKVRVRATAYSQRAVPSADCGTT
jgi:hypothetical protein